MISRLVNVPLTDPDDARRRKLLNILLAGMGGVALVAVLATLTVQLISTEDRQEITLTLMGSLAVLVGSLIIFVINRFWSGWVASMLFVLLLTAAIAFGDEPQQVVEGRSLFLFAIPILMASVLMRPWASFILAGLSSLIVAAHAFLALGGVPPVPSMLGLFAIALVAWLAARNLEQALQDLRAINRELDQRVAERTSELAQTLSENQAILESIADGVIVFDNDDRAVVANPAIIPLIGRQTAEVVNQDIESLMREEVDTADRDRLIRFLKDAEQQEPSVRLGWGAKTLSVSAAPVRSDVGQVTGTVAVFRDFTREAELERMKSLFVSTVSHELRTPLNAILGYADMLNEGVYGPLTDKQINVIKRILANARRQLNLVNDLLDQAQIEAGTLSLNYTSVNPAHLVEDMHTTMSVLADAKDLELVSHIDDDVPSMLYGDRQRTLQILINLVNNAIKFTEEGQVRVQISRPDQSHWTFQVSDTGPGISPDAQSYVFEPFRREDSSVTRRHSGAGLGLSIVKELVTLMGGEIMLESEVGQGTMFTVQLPLFPPERAKEQAKP